MKIKHIMSKPVVTVRRSATVKQVVKKMAEKKVGGVVIAEKKVPIGIFTKRDLLSVLIGRQDLNKTTVEEVMHTPVLPAAETDHFLSAARQMGKLNLRRFIVTDAAGKTSGIVTDLDIVRNYATRTFSYKVNFAAVSHEGLTCTPSTPLTKVAESMHQTMRTCCVVLKGKKPVGIINESLFIKLAARFKDPLKYKAGDKMVKRYCGAEVTDSLREAVLKMIKSDFRNIILSDDKGKFQGVVSLRELVQFIINAQM